MFGNPAVLLVAAIAAPCAFLAIKYWQRALFAVFVLMVFEGALRKWVFPSAQAQIYLLKDVILLAVYIGFLADGRKRRFATAGVSSIKITFVIALIFGIMEVFNPNSPSILVGLMGLKVYFLYVPIAFILPYAFNSPEHFFTLIRRYLLLAIPVAVLGFVQVTAGPDSSLSTYVARSDTAAMGTVFGSEQELVRTSGTFSYISGYTAFLTFIAFVALGCNFAYGWRVKNNWVPIVTLTLVVGAMFTTGSRAPVYGLIGALPIIGCFAVTAGVLSSKILVRFCLLIPVIALVALSISSRAFEGFMQRATEASTDSVGDRAFSPIYETMYAISNAPIFGIGIGTTHPSAVAIMGVDWPWWLGDLLVEVEVARVSVETGILGLILIVALRGLVVICALYQAMAFKQPTYRAFGIVLAVHLLFSMTGSIILNPTAGLYYWGALGLILAMKRFEMLAPSAAGKLHRPTRAKLTQATVPAS